MSNDNKLNEVDRQNWITAAQFEANQLWPRVAAVVDLSEQMGEVLTASDGWQLGDATDALLKAIEAADTGLTARQLEIVTHDIFWWGYDRAVEVREMLQGKTQ